ETDHTGTTTHFVPDPEIFSETTEYDYDLLANRVRELAFLTKGVNITIEDKREGQERKNEYHYEGGIKSYVEYLNRSKEVVHEEPIYIEGEKDGITVEVALQYNDSYTSNIYSFTNNINTYEGGTHEAGFKTGLTRVINDYARKKGLIKENDPNLSGDDVRE
ncbi:DNA topoisomerase IV subunit B, partial [Xanthomonas citri pv. citri]|nr:DNA topoisomerase IV subunit B [Xanthomonas citri pv. citri]